jgi:flagellar FliL protein
MQITSVRRRVRKTEDKARCGRLFSPSKPRVRRHTFRVDHFNAAGSHVAATAGKSKSKLWVMITVLIVVLAAAGTGAWWMLLKPPPEGRAHASATSSKPAPPAKPVFFKLDPFTVNIQGGDFGDKLLYVAITLQLGNDASQTYLQEHLPEVRNRLLMVLSDQAADTLTTSQGKHQLAARIKTSLGPSFTGTQPALAVHKVLFTQFILQ